MTQTALVTGASRGIGAALVEAFIARGMNVHALARPGAALDALCEKTGAVSVGVDLTDTAALEAALAGQRYDIVVNNAGIVTGVGPLHERSAEEIDRTIGLNLTSVLQTLRIVLPGMIAQGRGDVILLGSIAGQYAFPGTVTYAASKAAISGMVNTLRLELHDKGVRVTEVAPGRVATDIYLEAMKGDRSAMKEKLFETYQASLPEDIVLAVLAALDMPRRSNVAYIEVVPSRQAVGGFQFAEGFEED
jgi:NADP-dependent 3-hydroxy acid dehydrogenase YdfG